MGDAPAFNFVCDQIEARSSLDRLESRGTVRLALKSAGLEARSVLPGQMKVVIEKLLPKELKSRGIDEAEKICRDLVNEVVLIEPDNAVDNSDNPDEIFFGLAGE